MSNRAKSVCEECDAACCRNLAFAIIKPRTRHEIYDLKWKLHFDTVKVYVFKGRWHLLIISKCIYLSKKNLCKKYGQRPQVCRDHKPSSCEKTGEWYDKLISTPEELDIYLGCRSKTAK
ncbi:MAG: YkgJ family cysteine cluster protein [Candidatus Omnitrophota bacterium]